MSEPAASDAENSQATAILRTVAADKFKEIFLESPKQVRETIFARFDVRKKPTSTTRFAKPGEKNEARIREVFEILQDQDDDEVAAELLRNYFLKRRPLLAAALDRLKIPHEDGLTEADLDQFEKMSAGEAEKLKAELSQRFDPLDVALYLKFMKAPL